MKQKRAARDNDVKISIIPPSQIIPTIKQQQTVAALINHLLHFLDASPPNNLPVLYCTRSVHCSVLTVVEQRECVHRVAHVVVDALVAGGAQQLHDALRADRRTRSALALAPITITHKQSELSRKGITWSEPLPSSPPTHVPMGPLTANASYK